MMSMYIIALVYMGLKAIATVYYNYINLANILANSYLPTNPAATQEYQQLSGAEFIAPRAVNFS